MYSPSCDLTNGERKKVVVRVWVRVGLVEMEFPVEEI